MSHMITTDNQASRIGLHTLFSILVTMLAVCFSTVTTAQELPDFTSLVEDNASAIVNVNTIRRSNRSADDDERMEDLLDYLRERFGDRLPENPEEELRGFDQRPALGSGFIISDDGYIITNHHVIDEAKEITITLNDRREYQAEIVGSDVNSDLALLKIDAANLKPVVLGNSSELKVGEWVLAIGSPMGLRFSVAQGIISFMGRNIPNGSSGNYVSFIQTDVAINPGNSGGPLFNLAGEVIGINSQIFTSTGGSMGLSFAIPVDVAKNVVGQLKEKGLVERGWMGVGINEVSQEMADEAGLATPAGAVINQVIQGSPAEMAGFMAGDIIVRFNGNDINSSGDLPFHVGLTAPDSNAEVQVIRDGGPMSLSMTVGKLEADNSQTLGSNQDSNNPFGLLITELDREEGPSGVLVVNVTNAVGREADFQMGDILISINGQSTSSVPIFNEVVESLPQNQVIPALIERNGRQLFLTVRIPD
ncbi:MAG: Do family serine endopeptidase [Gammaproteobacteria bacterium]|nr:Do family serine endopeptidase [Gammaproteobacteria bacterium]